MKLKLYKLALVVFIALLYSFWPSQPPKIKTPITQEIDEIASEELGISGFVDDKAMMLKLFLSEKKQPNIATMLIQHNEQTSKLVIQRTEDAPLTITVTENKIQDKDIDEQFGEDLKDISNKLTTIHKKLLKKRRKAPINLTEQLTKQEQNELKQLIKTLSKKKN